MKLLIVFVNALMLSMSTLKSPPMIQLQFGYFSRQDQASHNKSLYNSFLLKVMSCYAGQMAFRDCHRSDVQNVCSDKEMEGHKVRICYETCNTDGCNGGPMITSAGRHSGGGGDASTSGAGVNDAYALRPASLLRRSCHVICIIAALGVVLSGRRLIFLPSAND